MKVRSSGIRLSPSDLMVFAECKHASWRYLEHAHGRGPEPLGARDLSLAQRGKAHEKAYQDELRAKGLEIVEIRGGDVVRKTKDALARGVDVVAQAALEKAPWSGFADFLERVDTPSDLGPYSYEVVDTKLKESPTPSHVLQLVVYSALIADLQGLMPAYAHLQLGSGERVTLRLAEFLSYASESQRRLEEFLAHPFDARPVPCDACVHCDWKEVCDDRWKAEDSLYRVAGIRHGQVRKLEAEGITSMGALADHEGSVPKLALETLTGLQIQAILQHARDRGSDPTYLLRTSVQGKGFDLLPRPDMGDLFYDIEGYPYYREKGSQGLEYLHGVWGQGSFKAFWAHTIGEEKAGLRALYAHFTECIEAFPDLHIYHYAPYEITALRRLTTRHGYGEAQLDQWLREERFVDLYSVVRGAIYTSEPGYSIKNLEVFYDVPRTSEIKAGDASITAYEEYRETGEQNILDQLEEYNRADCVSTECLRDWLLNVRLEEGTWEGTWRKSQPGTTEASIKTHEMFMDIRQMLDQSSFPEEERQQLYNLAAFHWREAKPSAWAVFDARDKPTEELLDDMTCLAGLESVNKGYLVGRSTEIEYMYPEQRTKLHEGSTVTVYNGESLVTTRVREMDPERRRLVLRISKKKAKDFLGGATLLPSFALNTNSIQTSIRQVIMDRCRGRGYSAIEDVLRRSSPRFKGRYAFDSTDDYVSLLKKAVRAMDETVLPVQGPPGTGKTYVAARAIRHLVRKRNRVAVSSNSHAAIHNLLRACVEAGLRKSRIVHKGPATGHDAVFTVQTNTHALLKAAPVVGGTAWLFAREPMRGAFDYLFVDEAGQVSLANLISMAPCARNIVLIGDPRQLPQVIQGAHPPGADLSCMDWMLGVGQNVAAGRGIMLDVTYRMHPAICRFISDVFYQGRVRSHPSTALQAVRTPGLPSAGAFRMAVEHEGRSQHSPEEVEAIAAMAARLIGSQWTDRYGKSRPIEPSDILVVAPYNAQVQALLRELSGIRVGTVDKFQGQEAPIVLVSMTDSSATDMARGLEFLLSPHRLNVAISRGKALSIVFAAPALVRTPCNSVDQMRLINSLCALPELSLD